jgi:ubiquinone/menaquinone biosynthesis C-methylase UbiE
MRTHAAHAMKTFVRSDAQPLTVVEGFRDWLLSYRASVTPKASWSDDDYVIAADKKRSRFQRLAASLENFYGSLKGASLLDVGCGDGINCLLFASQFAMRPAVGIDLHLSLFGGDERAQRSRRLVHVLLGRANRPDEPQHEQRADFCQMDATQMGFPAETFDIVISRSAMEHIRPVERVLAEILRVTRRGGLVYLGIDPFFWLRGCHKRGVVDIPWAHARMSLDDFETFVRETEGRETAAKRLERLATLNQFTTAEWRCHIDRLNCEVLDWRAKHSDIGQQLLDKYPEIRGTLLPNIREEDLLTERIEVWLRKP